MSEAPWLIPLSPLIAFAINGILGPRYLRRATGVIGSLGILTSFLLTIGLWLDLPKEDSKREYILYRWLESGSLKIDIGFTLDELTVVMLLVVTGVSFLIHVYSNAYMEHDNSFARFFTWLPLFVFSMIMLVMANNFLSLFVFWEMVGVCSYFLIGFWHDRDSANNAAMKAFITNRVGDFGFAAGIFLIFWNFGTVNYSEVHASIGTITSGVATTIALLLFVGAMGKSAQFPLHIWLPDAMEGPTPVSALIHAATMVTAGIFMVARNIPIFEAAGISLIIIGGIGAFTALFAATIAVTQTDIKRVLAYSTVSQLGLMFLALGSGAYVAAIFHLATHAFFKALLFLGSGSVIHSMQNEQNMHEYGGLKSKLPWTYATYVIGGLALSAIFPLAGFWSKDEILAGAFFKGASSNGDVLFLLFWIMGLTASLLTAFYTFRMIHLTFHGMPRNRSLYDHAHESPWLMVLPLVLLAALSVAAGIGLGFPPEHGVIHDYLQHVVHSKHFELTGDSTIIISLAIISTAIALIGMMAASAIYQRGRPSPEAMGRLFPVLYTLSYKKYYVDEMVDILIIKSSKAAGFVLWAVDAKLVDGMVNLLGWTVKAFSSIGRRIQTGQVQNYVLIMATGLVVSLGIIMVMQ